MTKTDILDTLESLSRERGYLYSLALMVMRDLSVNVLEILEIDWHARISFREFSFLFGLLVKQPINRELPSSEDIQRHIDTTYKLLHQLHECHMLFIKDKMPELLAGKEHKTETELEKDFKKLIGSGEWMTEPIFYGGSGAYGFQFLELARKRYQLDVQWLAEKNQISAEEMAALAQEIKALQERKARERPATTNHEDACHTAIAILSLHEDELISVSRKARKSFLKHFSLTPGTANQKFAAPGSYNQVESHPLIALGPNEYFLPIWFNLAQSIYESPFYWMLKDSQYRETSFKHRGDVTEEICYEMLAAICGQDKVFRNVKISRNKGETISDIDVLALLGSKAIVVQAKSKKLTELAKQGDEEQLRSDFKEGIQKAYEQGLVCRNSISDRNTELTSLTGQKIQIGEAINDVYIVCVTSDEYPAVMHQVDAYLSKTTNDPFPIVISVFDLQILTFYLSDPFDLFYYLRQRTKLASYFHGEEMALLGYHLNQKLYPREGANFVMVDQQFAQLIDANYPAARGFQKKTEAYEKLQHKWRNTGFQKLLTQIKWSCHPRVTDSVFLLLDLSGSGADSLMNAIEKTRSRARARGKQQMFTMMLSEGKRGLSYLAAPNNTTNIEESTLMSAMLKKHEMKADEWLGLGSVIGSEGLGDAVVYSAKPWIEDSKLAELSKVVIKNPGVALDSQMQKLGRNEPCYCGSGKKYKKCHGF
ncbi:MAG: SEC-C domain-containing protein [Nitrospirota bacterium]|nr:SEC-C domain-containing protein [Nitrospirota bacterium]